MATASSSSSSSSASMQQFTVGKLDAGMAILLGARASLIEFPSLLLPQDVQAGSVVEISVKRNVEEENRNKRDFDHLQREILDTFGTVSPVAPELRLRATTQTSVVLEWSQLTLATAQLISLDIYRNGSRLAPIPSPLSNTSTKLSGLEVGVEYNFHLVLKTSAGTLTSNSIRTTTHAMTNTSGISVCFGAVGGGGQGTGEILENGEEVSALEGLTRQLLEKMGAKCSTRLQIDTTHYVCTSPRARAGPQGANGSVNAGGEGPVYRKALALNIPIVRPEWIVACYESKKMMPISAFYLDKEPPNVASVSSLLQARKQESAASSASPPPPAPKDEISPAPAAAPAPPSATPATSVPPPQSATISPGEEPGSAALTFGEVEDQTTGPEGEPLTADDGKSGGTAGEAKASDVQEEDQEEGQGAPGDSAVAAPEAEQVGSATTAPSTGSESMEDVSLNSVGGDQSPMRRTGNVDEDDDEAGEEVDLS